SPTRRPAAVRLCPYTTLFRSHDDGRVQRARLDVAGDCQAPTLWKSLRKGDVSTPTGTARLSARARLQDVYRLRRWRRLHARLGQIGEHTSELQSPDHLVCRLL